MRAGPVIALLFVSGGLGCDRCGTGELRQGGATPYVRCLTAAPRGDAHWKLGKLSLSRSERALDIAGVSRPVRIAAFAGPSPGEAPPQSALDALAAAAPNLVIVLGGLGDSDTVALETARRLAALRRPVLFVAGATDDPERVERALAAQGEGPAALIDVTRLDAIRLGPDVLLPVAGAFEGRYALGPGSCGFSLEDLKQRASRVGERPDAERRWLLAWQAPGGGGARAVARGPGGGDLGVADLAELARRVGAPGGLFAWPTTHVGSARDASGKRTLAPGEPAPGLRLVVPRLWGPPQARGDGSLSPPAFALLELRKTGLALLSVERVYAR